MYYLAQQDAGWSRYASYQLIRWAAAMDYKCTGMWKARTCSRLSGPHAQKQKDYVVPFFNAVDKSNHNNTDWSSSIHTNRYYIHILCWLLLLDQVVLTPHVVVMFCMKKDLGPDSWMGYQEKTCYSVTARLPNRFWYRPDELWAWFVLGRGWTTNGHTTRIAQAWKQG